MIRSQFFASAVALLCAAATLSAQEQQKKPTLNAVQTTTQTTIPQTPWYTNQNIRQELKLNEEQIHRLNEGYNEAHGRYQRGYDVLFSDRLTESERARRLRELDADFNKNFSGTVDRVLANPDQRQRYNQLWYQYQGYNAFTNPPVAEKLNLTVEQRQRLSRMNEEWDRELVRLETNFRNDRDSAVKRWDEMRKRRNERTNTVLTPDQQRMWQQMSGAQYNFDPTIFLPNSIRR